jgi:hypothetical protein
LPKGPPLVPNASCPHDWRLNRELRFVWEQQRARQWINFREIAEWLLDLDGRNAYDMLQRDLLAGDFEEGGRSRVLYLNFRTKMARMTRPRLSDAMDTFPGGIVISQYLARCWIPRQMFVHWLAKHELPRAPARFKPRKETREFALASDETAITKALAERLRVDPNMTRRAAETWCRQAAPKLSVRGFKNRVWPNARKMARLEERARAGRKPKSAR